MATADLDIALAFVTGRIEAEANRSGKPLTEEERYLLNHLPKDPPVLQTTAGFEEFPPDIVPRDYVYERLCATGKAAHARDLASDPATTLDWDFAFAVSLLNHHPMSWLLEWAGMKKPKPRSDRSLLILAASTLVLGILMPGILFLVGEGATWSRILFAAVGAILIAVSVGLFTGSRRRGDLRLRRNIERYHRRDTAPPVP